MFKDFIMEERLKKDLSIRNFCKLTGEDPSNWSKIERGVMNPPTDEKRLLKIAEVLEFDKDSEQYKKLYDLATNAVGIIPDYIQTDKEIMNFLPAFFRTIDNIKPTREDLEDLINSLRENGIK